MYIIDYGISSPQCWTMDDTLHDRGRSWRWKAIMCVSGHLPGHKFDNLEESFAEGKGEAFEHPQNML